VARQHPMRTWSRWFYWQVRQRVTQRPKNIPFFGGTCLRVYPHEGLTGYWYVGMPDYEEMVFLQRFLRSGDIFYDVGANSGPFAVLAAGLGCAVTAFEPVSQTFQRLSEHATLNRNHGALTPLNVAVGSHSGTLRMTTGFGTGNHVLKPQEDAPFVEVPVVTLDEIANERSTPNFIKMDVEGHELEALRGAESILQSHDLQGLLLETFRPHNWRQQKLQAIESLLSEHGFYPYKYEVEGNEIVPLRQPQDGGDNTFYFRSAEFVRSRLLETTKGKNSK
jgi:FkbM family methyltransferase